MSREQENVQLVQQYFALIGQGNVRAAIDMLAEDVDFQSPVTRTVSKEISWAKSRHSREEVITFFQEFLQKVDFEQINLFEFTAQGDRVVVEGRNRGRVKATDRTYEHDWAMVFTIRGGKIVRHRHYYDTADVVAAFRS
jgi:hypothetical protein